MGIGWALYGFTMSMKNYRRLNVRPDTFELIMVKCKEYHLRFNPDHKPEWETHDHLLNVIGKYFLEH